jgi:hypothetical protein
MHTKEHQTAHYSGVSTFAQSSELLHQRTDVAVDEVPTSRALIRVLYLEQDSMGTGGYPLWENQRPKEMGPSIRRFN